MGWIMMDRIRAGMDRMDRIRNRMGRVGVMCEYKGGVWTTKSR